MKISFTTMATPELDIPSQFEAAKAYGFDGVDLRVIERGMGEIPKDLSDADAARILQMRKEIEVPTLLCYNEKVQSGSDAMTASVMAYMRLAAKLHIPTIRIFTGLLDTPEDMETLSGVLKGVFAQDTTGVNIAMQNHINCSVTLEQALAVCQQVSDPRLSVILSPDHAALIGEELEPLLPRLAPYTSQLYLADTDEQNKSVLPGEGRIPYGKIIHTLRENGFDGYVTLKWERCWHPELPHYETAFRAFRALMNEVRGT